MRQVIVFTIACSLVGRLEAQRRIPSPDSLRAQAAVLSGCYQFPWGDSIPALPSRLPTKLQLSERWFRKLGYHMVGFFEARPAQLQRGAYVAWRPRGRDSLDIALTARSTASPEDLMLSGRVDSDTLKGVITLFTILPDSGHSVPTYSSATVGHFKAARTRCS